MNNRNMRMDICFKFQVKECQNASLETWIKAAKFSKNIPIRSENMDRMWT